MNKNSVAIISLCSSLCNCGVAPLSCEEWSALALTLIKNGIQPMELLGYSCEDFIKNIGVDNNYAKRLFSLIGRTAALYFELSKYENIGISVVTRADSTYPKELKRELGRLCPPLFYFAGDISIFDREHICLKEKDTLIENSEKPVVKYVSSLMKSIKSASSVKAVQKRRLLLLSQNI